MKKNPVWLWRIKAPKGPLMSHMAKLRSEHSSYLRFQDFSYFLPPREHSPGIPFHCHFQ